MPKFYLALLGFLLACSSETIPPDPDRVGFTYFPLQVGDFRIYQVHQEEFSIFAQSDTFDFQIKELVVDSFPAQNEFTYVLHRFSRADDTQPWDLDSVWTARRTANHAIRVENNVPFAKIVFPVVLDKVWDGNVFNTRAPEDYQITDVGGSWDTPAENFTNTLTVFENQEPDTLIFQDIRQSVYARNVGLIYRFSSILDFCNSEPSCLGTLEVGTKIEQVLIEYGME
ncbi:MAG: hypothetical protein OER04_14460 [Cyclobacteriaceae bacterium]|nr:hypothetical protein [Cyclobacteriaceae bacterium]